MAMFFLICLIILSIMIAIFRFCTEYVLLIEDVLLGIGAYFLTQNLFTIHPAFSLLIGIVVVVLMLALQRSPVGFLIIGGIFSLLWGFLFGIIAYDSTGGDMIWMFTVWGIGTIIAFVLHHLSREKIGIS